MVMKFANEIPCWKGEERGGKHVTEKMYGLLHAPDTVEQAGVDREAAEWPRVVDGRLLYRGEVKVGDRVLPVCEEASFTSPMPEDPEAVAEAFAGYYDGNFPETTEHDISSHVEIKAPMKYKDGGRGKVKAHLAATGHLVVGSIPQSDEPATPEGLDLFAQDMRRLLYLREGKISRSADLASRKEACRSLARLASLRKSLAEIEEQGRRFACHSSDDALLELEASLAGALAYRSADGKHPAVYIPVANLIPTSLYLQITPAELQRTLLRVFERAWGKLGAASRRHGEKISHVAVVLDFNDMSQLDLAAYSTHRLLGDIGEVLRAYCPWLVYKIVVFKLQFAREFLWELLRPALQANCRVVTAEDEDELLQEIQADGTFILHTLGGFNECSVLRCRRPVYRLPQPPQPLGASEWFSKEGETTDFWEDMQKLYAEAPGAPPEEEPVDDIKTSASDQINAALSRQMQDESREEALQSKENELKDLIIRRECLLPHFKKALKQVFNTRHADVEFVKAPALPEKELARPSFSMKDVTKSDVQICIWNPPANEVEAARETTQMLLNIFEKRSLWTHPPLPPNYMHAFERTTYPLDCVHHSRSVSLMKPQQTPLSTSPTPTKGGLTRPAQVKENLPYPSNKAAWNALNFL